MTEEFRIDPARTAPIVQDLQNDVLAEGGAWADSGAPEHARSQNIVENVAKPAEKARGHGTLEGLEPSTPPGTRQMPGSPCWSRATGRRRSTTSGSTWRSTTRSPTSG